MTSDGRARRFFEFLNRRIGRVAAGLVLLAVLLAIAGPMLANDESVNFSPSGSIYETADLAEDAFESSSPIRGAAFLVEHPDGDDVLTQEFLYLWKQRTDALRNVNRDVDGLPLNARLETGGDLELGIVIDGIYSIADAVDARIPGGLDSATEGDVKVALSELLAADSPTVGLRGWLSQHRTQEVAVVGGRTIDGWKSPAFIAQLRYDHGSFQGPDVNEEQEFLDSEAWLIEVQTELRGGHKALPRDAELDVRGIAISFNTEFEDSFLAGVPFIFLAVALIVFLVGALLRSYWAAAVAAAGLGVTMLTYSGVVALVQLDESPLLQLIVPIAMISFGVDFFIHGAGRVREAQVEGFTREHAYPVGMTAVFTALILAATTSAAAFLSNAVSGIEAITEFGEGAAIALLLSYFFLGLIAPRILIGIEGRIGPRPVHPGWRIVLYKVLFTLSAIVAGIVVATTVAMPPAGAIAFLVFLGLFVYLPYWSTKRRHAKAAELGMEVTDEIRGAGHGFVAAGSVVHFLARWRVVTLPVVALLAIGGTILAFNVKTEFQFSDFLPRDSEAVISLDRWEEHSESGVGGTGYVYVEGDLTDPGTLETLEAALTGIVNSGADFAPDFEGKPRTSDNAASIVRAAMASPPAIQAISASGTTLTDDDGNGLPDTAAQVAAVYDYARGNGIPNAQGDVILRADIVEGLLYSDGTKQATRLEVIIPSFTDDALILDGRRALQDAADSLASVPGVQRVGISGDPITNQDTLAAFIDAMLMSLPVAIALATLLAWLVMRSLKYAFTSIVPILFVVAWVYGFMFLTDLAVNPVTATIAAIAIGVGIDFATHFTVRFREEFEGEPSRFPALRRAGEGTGGALALSALTSIVGFWALALAPTPIFATFGQLTAVMIFFALAVSLLVLPSLLIVVTPSRKGDERYKLISAMHVEPETYHPHDRATAEIGREHAPPGG
jgi:predicted RND superfamily exporter protein